MPILVQLLPDQFARLIILLCSAIRDGENSTVYTLGRRLSVLLIAHYPPSFLKNIRLRLKSLIGIRGGDAPQQLPLVFGG